eukprot:scaffold144465_cov30-Tisochrysis_lutea.AAC.3
MAASERNGLLGGLGERPLDELDLRLVQIRLAYRAVIGVGSEIECGQEEHAGGLVRHRGRDDTATQRGGRGVLPLREQLDLAPSERVCIVVRDNVVIAAC